MLQTHDYLTAQWTKTRPQHRELHVLLFTISVWVLKRPLLTRTMKMQETGPTVFRPYPRGLEYLYLVIFKITEEYMLPLQ